ncbi:hypothetical protein SI65_09064 [Aspergillus cristatus]|uniref:Uncharacterized protein n=1 Tax=Aspergillus cristatus TaxID=573508 RepID=A0A1E3B3R3_ASPCR|nr:hypothetical protein SI65_09064 [Aspergillus cristatus]
MSNKISEMEESEDFPYCIWYPETAAEETYRALAARYPQMKYLVGGACAVAGYVNLFHELDLLPESHIVEEARDNQQWEIYEAIMKPELRYNAMDDCTRTVFDKPEIKTKFAKPPDSDAEIGDLLSFRRRAYFDITEDDWVDEYDSKEPRFVKDDVSHLLYTHLPSDLPTMDKDLLIQTAAYYGDIDRQIVEVRSKKQLTPRFIMNNDLSCTKPETRHLPYCIWYPSVPHPSTCLELIRRASSMKPAVARVCILADYPETWDKVDPDPDLNLMRDA